MQDLLKRYFWVLGALAAMICAIFAAKATSHIIEAKVLSDSDKPHVRPVVAPSPMEPVKQSRSKDGATFASRNIFCSECTPPVVAVNNDPSQIQNTNLPVVLLATMIAGKPDQSYATIVNTDSQKQGSYAIGDTIPGATGAIKEIHFKYVDFENQGHVERLVLAGATAPITPVAQEQPATPVDGDDLMAHVDNGIKKIDDSNYEIDKALIDKVLQNPMAVAKGARVVPSVKNGKPDGFKLYAIRPSSAYAKLGLANGDTLQVINGIELNSMDKALEAYNKLRDANSFELEITRRGKPMTLKYTIR